jgi:hypothetical protein
VYTDFLRWLERDVTVHVVVPNRQAFDELVAAIGKVDCELRPIVVDHPMTAWSRDRWIALLPAAASKATTLWSPRGEMTADIWPERAGDERIAFDIAAELKPAVRAERSSLYFDGGDFLADSDTIFVMPRVLQRNIQITVRTRDELLDVFSHKLKRKVVLLEEAPDHHAGMFMALAGNGIMLVGDPRLAKRHFPSSNSSDLALLPGGADFTSETQRTFDAVAIQSEAAGYKVVRVPVVPAPDGRTFLTWVNSIIDRQGHQRIVYLPFYKGAESLNDAARRIWEDLGYEVRPVDSTSAYRHFGALHCLVNVLSRE